MNKMNQAVELICGTDMSNRKIGGIVGIAYNTVRRYRRLINKKQLTWADVQAMSAEDIERFLGSKYRNSSNRRVPDWDYIHRELQQRDVTRSLLWEEYRLANPDDALSMSQFNELYNQYRRKLDLTMRQPHRAGECAFVDFAGTTIPWADPQSGEKRTAQVFVGVMGCSNYTFAYAVASQAVADWVEAHMEMFRFFGRAPQVVVSDNLKAAVTRPGRDPEINRNYLESLRWYGVVPIPARVYRPQDKAKGEVSVQYVQRWLVACLRHEQFFSLTDINVAIARLLPRLNERKFRRLPGNRRSRFVELDYPMMRDLPAQPFEHAEWTASQKVGPDYHAYVEKHYYSVPCALVQERIEARVGNRTVEIFHKGKRVAVHVRSREIGGTTTLPEHQPPQHRHYAERSPEHFLEWAQTVGTAAVAAVQYQLVSRPHALLGLKACSSLQKLSKDYNAERFEAACRRAQAIGSLTVKSIRSILQRKLAEAPHVAAPVRANLPAHDNIRGASYYGTGGN